MPTNKPKTVLDYIRAKEKIGYNLCKECNIIWQVYNEIDGKRYCPKCKQALGSMIKISR